MASISEIPQKEYPKNEQITLNLHIIVEDAEDREYFLTPTGELQTSFLIDVFDSLDQMRDQLLSINGKTLRQLQAEMRQL